MLQIEAEQKLREANIEVSAIYRREALQPEGRVLHATPSAGTILGRTEEQTVEVALLVSAGLGSATGTERASKVAGLLGEKMWDESSSWLGSLVGLRPTEPKIPTKGAGENVEPLFSAPVETESESELSPAPAAPSLDLITRLQSDEDFLIRLVEQLYPRLEQKLARELRINREQSGRLADHNYS